MNLLLIITTLASGFPIQDIDNITRNVKIMMSTDSAKSTFHKNNINNTTELSLSTSKIYKTNKN